MSKKMFGSYSDDDLNYWEQLPMPSKVLTSSAFGAWLMRRDENRDKCVFAAVKSEIEQVKAIMNDLIIEQDRKDLVNFVNGLNQCMVVIEKSEGTDEKQVELSGDGSWDGQIVYDTGRCPICGREFEYGFSEWEEPYCCHCGTKLHWFDNKE